MKMRKDKRRALFGLLGPGTLFLGVFFLGPLLIIFLFSFLEPGLYGGVVWKFYGQNYGRIFGFADGIREIYEPIYLLILFRSLILAVFTVLGCFVICYPVTFWVARLPHRWQSFFMFLIVLPFFTSLIVRLYAWLLILKPQGIINQLLMNLHLIKTPLDILYTPFAVVLGMIYIMIPFMFLPLYASVSNLDQGMVEASADLGASRWQSFYKVILPQTSAGIIAGAVIVFIPSVGNFVVPDILGGAKGLMIGNLVEQQFLSARNWPFGSALSIMIMAIVLMVLMFAIRKGYRATMVA